MTVQGQLKAMLVAVAEALGEELRARLVFVGGCTTALYIPDPIVLEGVRATDDVDLIVDLAGFAEWVALTERLRACGFTEAAADDSVICRMKLGELKVDFMPDDEAILGFSNRWYAKGIETAVPEQLEEALEIRRLTPELFVATKLEAHRGRGEGDLIGSRDAEDILLLVDGREQLLEEIASGEPDIREYIAEQIAELLDDPNFDHFLEGNIRGPAGRVDIVYERLLAISTLGSH
jgi:predicted nucleotidyltransferase